MDQLVPRGPLQPCIQRWMEIVICLQATCFQVQTGCIQWLLLFSGANSYFATICITIRVRSLIKAMIGCKYIFLGLMKGLPLVSSNFPVGIFPLERRMRPSDCKEGTDWPLNNRNRYIPVFTLGWVFTWLLEPEEDCELFFPFVPPNCCKLFPGPICQTSKSNLKRIEHSNKYFSPSLSAEQQTISDKCSLMLAP